MATVDRVAVSTVDMMSTVDMVDTVDTAVDTIRFNLTF